MIKIKANIKRECYIFFLVQGYFTFKSLKQIWLLLE